MYFNTQHRRGVPRRSEVPCTLLTAQADRPRGFQERATGVHSQAGSQPDVLLAMHEQHLDNPYWPVPDIQE